MSVYGATSPIARIHGSKNKGLVIEVVPLTTVFPRK